MQEITLTQLSVGIILSCICLAANTVTGKQHPAAQESSCRACEVSCRARFGRTPPLR